MSERASNERNVEEEKYPKKMYTAVLLEEK